MRGLEACLELRLFNRTTRSVALTEARGQLFQRGRPLLGDLESAVNEVTSARNTPSGSIRLSASESSFRPLIRHVIPGFLAANPQILGRSASIDVDGPMTMDNLNLMVEAALAGIGVAWVPEVHVTEHVEAGRLIRLLPECSPYYPGLCLYYPANRHPPMVLGLFAQAVREWANQGL